MKRLLLALSLAFTLYSLNAQSFSLVVQTNEGVETTWTSDNLRNIHFDGETTLIVVEKESLTTHAYRIAEIKKMTFTGGLSLSELSNNESSFVYPNPAKDHIRIIGIENHEIEVLSYDGKIVYKGLYREKLDISHLSQGLYIIKTSNQTLKFNKI